MALHRRLGDVFGAAVSGLLLGHADGDERDFAGAQAFFEESLRGFEEAGDDHYVLAVTRLLAWTQEELGDRARSRSLYEDVVRRARVAQNQRMLAMALGPLGEYALDEAKVPEARVLLEESSRILWELSEMSEIALSLGRLARLLAAEGRAEAATRVLSSEEALCERMGISLRFWLERMNDATRTTIRERLDEAAFADAWKQGRTLTVDETFALALDSVE
jgi:tetratricopeptide (TPR) repeat protein